MILLSEGQMSDYKGAALMSMRYASQKFARRQRLRRRWFRNALAQRGVVPCIPSKANRGVSIPHDSTLYRYRHKIENMIAKL